MGSAERGHEAQVQKYTEANKAGYHKLRAISIQGLEGRIPVEVCVCYWLFKTVS